MQAGWEERRQRIDVGWCRKGNGRVWKSDKDAPETCCRPPSKPATFREQNYLSENNICQADRNYTVRLGRADSVST